VARQQAAGGVVDLDGVGPDGGDDLGAGVRRRRRVDVAGVDRDIA